MGNDRIFFLKKRIELCNDSYFFHSYSIDGLEHPSLMNDDMHKVVHVNIVRSLLIFDTLIEYHLDSRLPFGEKIKQKINA